MIQGWRKPIWRDKYNPRTDKWEIKVYPRSNAHFMAGANVYYPPVNGVFDGEHGGNPEIMMCCGAAGIAGLDTITVPEARAACRFYKRAKFGMLMAITAKNQTDAAAVLAHVGFKSTLTTYNPNSGSQITLWAIDLNSFPEVDPPTDYATVVKADHAYTDDPIDSL